MFSESGFPPHFLLMPLNREEIEDILAIEQACFSLPWTRNIFLHELSSPLSRNLASWSVTPERRLLVGYAFFWIVADEMELQKIAVRPEFRRQGAATALVEALLATAQQESCLAAFLEVRHSNRSAIRLYEKLGFVVKGIRRGYYSESGEDALIMERALCPSDGFTDP